VIVSPKGLDRASREAVHANRSAIVEFMLEHGEAYKPLALP